MSAENEQISFIAAILPTFFALKKLKDFRRRSIRPYAFMIYETTLVLLLKKKYLVAQPPHIPLTQGSKYLKKCPNVYLKVLKSNFLKNFIEQSCFEVIKYILLFSYNSIHLLFSYFSIFCPPHISHHVQGGKNHQKWQFL